MTDEQILKMLEEIVSEVDYDFYKDYFVEGYAEEPELIEASKQRMVKIVKKHLS